MAEPYGTNGGVHVDVTDNDGEIHTNREETLYGIFHRLIVEILFPGSTSAGAAAPLFQRIKTSLAKNGPLLHEASRNSGRNVLLWTRRGSPLRALLVISVGTITLLALTGLLVFTLFFAAATFNAVAISLLLSLAAAGGFLAIFFACVTVIYIGALSVALFVISATTISAIGAVLIATGWIGFFWIMWLATTKSLGLAKQSLNVTGSVISAYSYGRHARHHSAIGKASN
ncbi:uncharacterized protein LOC103959464 isoform X2 [Pyrus x bretschneideri]|uniref:uncharacterized protein LOC103959464 isoform X2 n=1 Tax=Pyrus x bretschneideri TaxID=225117 RepID=UPI00202E1A6A|nr:uncharacterized protein LOC103959464 isoform X2 [Pyrus x bretschneideri]